MLISYKNKFIFIHNFKVAGTSIKTALNKSALKNPTNYTILNKLLEHKKLKFLDKLFQKIPQISYFNDHYSALEVKKKIPDHIWKNSFKFGFVRNPWDRQVSFYHYMLKNKDHYQHKLIKKMSFDEYIKWRVSKGKHSQKEFFCDENGNIIVDFIGKFENLEQDFNFICKKIGIPAKLSHLNKSDHKDYRKYYNKYTKNLLAKFYKEDIGFFNYKF